MFFFNFKREAKGLGGSMNLREKLPLFNQVKDLGISCDGSKVTMTIMKVITCFYPIQLLNNFDIIIFIFFSFKENNIPDSNLYLWNLEKDNLGYFDFQKGLNDVDEVAFSSNENQDDKTAYEK